MTADALTLAPAPYARVDVKRAAPDSASYGVRARAPRSGALTQQKHLSVDGHGPWTWRAAGYQVWWRRTRFERSLARQRGFTRWLTRKGKESARRDGFARFRRRRQLADEPTPVCPYDGHRAVWVHPAAVTGEPPRRFTWAFLPWQADGEARCPGCGAAFYVFGGAWKYFASRNPPVPPARVPAPQPLAEQLVIPT